MGPEIKLDTLTRVPAQSQTQGILDQAGLG